MPRVRLNISYDGTAFKGWAAQPGLRTVQGELEGALRTILGRDVALTVAGRTDSGVHATGQVASFEAPSVPDALAKRLNAVLPRDVAVRLADEAAPDFDARRDARSRTYRYRLLASPVRDPFEEGRALWWPHRVDRDALDACAEAVVGTQDFTAFTPTETHHVRFEREVIRCVWTDPPTADREREPPKPGAPAGEGVIALEIEADAFMRHMVRVLVGTMLEVAGGRRDLGDFRALLDGALRERAGDTAPPHGLYLTAIRYAPS